MGVCCDGPNTIEGGPGSGGSKPISSQSGPHPFAHTLVKNFKVGGRTLKYYSLPALSDERY